MITSEEIKRRLWDGANELRGSMDASRYKDYMLGLMFYKFLSDKTLKAFKELLEMDLAEDDLVKEYEIAVEEHGEGITDTIKTVIGFYVKPKYLYQKWLQDIDSGDFELDKVSLSLNDFERSVGSEGGLSDFKGLFASSTINLADTALGSNLNERSKNIKSLISLFADLNMVDLQESDVLGDAYEYLIGQFAMEAGKKAGEFYTPHQVSEIMAQIVSRATKIESIYDPTVGSGSLLLTVGKHLNDDEKKKLRYFGQEKNTATYNLTRMNLLLHGVRPEMMHIKNGDTLSHDWPEDPNRPNEGVQFDAVVMNPPYSLKNWNKEDLKISDPRFEIAGVLPPNSKGDFAFLLHGLYHLRTNGAMAIVLPHGVLFRGGTEGEIRKRLIEKNYLDVVIGLPSNLFTNTGIPVTILILKKNRNLQDSLLFIDASNEFVKSGKQNVLLAKHISKIVDTYIDKRQEEGYSYLASRETIISNDYNLNIPRYVSPINDEIPHDVDAHLLGGIPLNNLKELKVINSLVPNILTISYKLIRPGYVEFTKSLDELTEDILQSDEVQKISNRIEKDGAAYVNKYWDSLRQVNDISKIRTLMDDMLTDIKSLLSSFSFIDIYSGYQIVAELWNNYLLRDLEPIAFGGFYKVAREREPNFVSKGTKDNKTYVQKGWIGKIIPNELIAKILYKDIVEKIEKLKANLNEIESEHDEIVENTKVENTQENEVLYDLLKRNNDDEPGDSFIAKLVRDELKLYEKDSDEYALLKKVEFLMDNKSEIAKEIRALESDLSEAVNNRYLTLTESEIDLLIYEKWFGDFIDKITGLVTQPLKEDLDLLKLLKERYDYTLDEIDEEFEKIEKSFKSLLDELVVI